MNTVYVFPSRMTVTDIGVTFFLKHSNPGRKLGSFHYRAYNSKKVCVADCLKEYFMCRSTKVQTDAKSS